MARVDLFMTIMGIPLQLKKEELELTTVRAQKLITIWT